MSLWKKAYDKCASRGGISFDCCKQANLQAPNESVPCKYRPCPSVKGRVLPAEWGNIYNDCLQKGYDNYYCCEYANQQKPSEYQDCVKPVVGSTDSMSDPAWWVWVLIVLGCVIILFVMMNLFRS